MRSIVVAVCVASSAVCALLPAHAQNSARSGDPNLGHFYMARQQIQILDDAPQVNDMRTNPAAGGAGGGGMGAMNRPVGLPRAGFMPYSQSIPSLRNSLPSTVNGVPQKPPPMAVSPQMGNAGKYKGTKTPAPAAPKASAPTVAKTYAPYKGYGGGSPSVPVSSGAPAMSDSGNVKGRLLHWSRTR